MRINNIAVNNMKINISIIVYTIINLLVIFSCSDISDYGCLSTEEVQVKDLEPKYRIITPRNFECSNRFEVIQIFDYNIALVKEINQYYLATGRILCLFNSVPQKYNLFETISFNKDYRFIQIGEYDYRLGNDYIQTIPVIQLK